MRVIIVTRTALYISAPSLSPGLSPFFFLLELSFCKIGESWCRARTVQSEAKSDKRIAFEAKLVQMQGAAAQASFSKIKWRSSSLVAPHHTATGGETVAAASFSASEPNFSVLCCDDKDVAAGSDRVVAAFRTGDRAAVSCPKIKWRASPFGGGEPGETVGRAALSPPHRTTSLPTKASEHRKVALSYDSGETPSTSTHSATSKLAHDSKGLPSVGMGRVLDGPAEIGLARATSCPPRLRIDRPSTVDLLLLQETVPSYQGHQLCHQGSTRTGHTFTQSVMRNNTYRVAWHVQDLEPEKGELLYTRHTTTTQKHAVRFERRAVCGWTRLWNARLKWCRRLRMRSVFAGPLAPFPS